MNPFPPPAPPPRGIAGRLAAMFIESRLTPILVIASILLGVFAVLQLPREEEPQIKVPMVDVMVALPGADPVEVENRLARPLEKLLWEIPDVEYLYTTSSPGHAMVIVRFKVGTAIEDALIRLSQKLAANTDRIPPDVPPPLIKPRTIDDVPILALTLSSATHDHLTLRRLAAQLEDTVKAVPAVAETTLIGGNHRAVRVALDPAALSARSLTTDQVAAALRAANQAAQLGSRPFANTALLLETGDFLSDTAAVGSVVIGARAGRPIYLRDVATIADTAAEPANYVLHGTPGRDLRAAVTLSVAKRPGATLSMSSTPCSSASSFNAASSSPPRSSSPSPATTATPPLKNPTSSSSTWASPSLASLSLSSFSSAGASPSSSCSPSPPPSR